LSQNTNPGFNPCQFKKMDDKKTKVETPLWKLAKPAVCRKLDFGKQRLCKLTKNN
jgi:hypothetical protein